MEKQAMLQVTEYTTLGKLPPLLRFEDGTAVESPEDWPRRRKELYKTAVELQYGVMPPAPEFLEVEIVYRCATAYSLQITTGPRSHPIRFYVRVMLPPDAKDAPIIVDGDMCFDYAFDSEFLGLALRNHIGWAFFDRTQLAHDIQNEGRCKGQLYEAYPECTCGAIGAWAWGYSRCVDALLQLGLVKEDRIVFTGHSRGGKTCLLAGVLDERAAIVNPNETCAGAGACYRVHMRAVVPNGEEQRSETLADLMRNYGFWMGEGMYDYTECEEKLPFDCHFLKALVAPRTLFMSDAVHDIWGNPLGTWQSSVATQPAYHLLGADERLLWYFRDGDHAHAHEDVRMLVEVIRHTFYGEPLSDSFFRRPFEALPMLLTDE